MAGNIDLRGKIDIETGPAAAGLQALSARFERLAANANTSNATLSKVGSAMRSAAAAAKTETDALANLAKAQANVNKTAAEAGKVRAQTANIRGNTQNAAAVTGGQVALLDARSQTEAVRQNALETQRLIAVRRQEARETQAAAAAADRHNMALASSRYAMYDVASGARTAGLAMLALSVATVGVSVAWERDFANVIRTTSANTGQEIEYLRAQFVDLARTIPVAFGELSEIGTLAGQLGVARGYLTDFTRTVAMFSATSDVSVNDAATAFGRLASLIPDAKNFRAVADSVLKVGVNSAATEGQILKVATQISSLTAAAGMGYQSTVGLAGALASVAVPPELSRGVITRVFGQIDKAVAQGGTSLEKFGIITGQTGAKFAETWKNDAPLALQQFMTGLRDETNGGREALEGLGITSVRDIPVLLRLASAAGEAGTAGSLFTQTMRDAANAAGELQKQYNIVADTTAGKFQILAGSAQAFLDKIGSATLPMFGDILENVTDTLKGLTDSLDENIRLFGIWDIGTTNGELLAMGAVLTGIIGITGLLVAGLGQVAGGILAMAQLRAAVGPMGEVFSHLGTRVLGFGGNVEKTGITYNGFHETMKRTPGIAGKAAVAFNTVSTAAMGLTRILGPLALAAAVMGTIDWAGKAGETKTDFDAYEQGLLKADSALKTFLSTQRNTQETNWGLGDATENVVKDAQELRKAIDSLPKDDSFWANFGNRTFNMTQYTKATQVIDDFDKSFQNLMDSGNSSEAFTSLAAVTTGLKLTGDQLDTFIERAPSVEKAMKSWLVNNDLKVNDENLRSLARGTLPEYRQAMEQTLGVVKGTADAFEEGADGMSDFLTTTQEALAGVVDYGGAYATAVENANTRAKDAWVAGGNAVGDFKEVTTASLGEFLDELEAQVEAQMKLATNLAKIVAKAGPEVAAEAAKLPPQLVDALANGTDEEMHRFAEAVANGGEQATTSLATTITSLAAPKVVAAMSAMGTEAAAAWTEAIITGQKTVDDLLAAKPGVMPIDANTEPAQGTLERFRNHPEVTAPVPMDVKAETEGATQTIGQWARETSANAPKPKSFVDLSTTTADSKIKTFTNTNRGTTVRVDANTDLATQQVEAFRRMQQAKKITLTTVISGGSSGNGESGGTSSGGGGGGGGRATGGYVTGPGTGTSDSIPTRLSNGEFVMTAAATRFLGPDYLYNLMHSAQRGYATGGLVTPVTQSTPNYNSYMGNSAALGAALATLDAQSLQAILSLANRPIIVYSNDRAIAESAARGAEGQTQIGTN